MLISEEILAPVLTIVILLALALWVPTLGICNARCQSILRWRANRTTKPEDQPTAIIEPAQ